MGDDEHIYEYCAGFLDCLDGLAQQSNDPDYVHGYRDQYALEQRLTAQGEANELS